MADVQGIIFDCFGVIYSNYVDNYIIKNYDNFYKYTNIIENLNSQIDLGIISQRDFYKKLEEISGLKAGDIQKGMESELVSDINLLKIITMLKLRYKLGLLSNAGDEEISVIYKDNIDKLFDVITISYQEGISKPNKNIFQACIDKLGLNYAETLFIDDSKTNIDAAKKLGMKTIHYKKFNDIPDALIRLI